MSSNNIDWSDTIKKEAEGINGEDFGEVQDISNGLVLVQRGILNKERFLIPQELAESYDGDIVRFRISENEVLSKYREGAEGGGGGERAQTETTTGDVVDREEEDTISLTEERLDVSKDVKEDQVQITKEPITETKTVEVPVTHEEVSIETRPASGGEGQVSSEGPVTSTQEISIPVKKEEVEVSKTPYVKEEVTVKKKPVTETREITEEVTSERVSTEESS
ncbi:MAG TPA: YsnF/AvaK domain-containing protein [Candidatus Saccharimonadales bacterium]|nr:YsnF/AvaK domain-containing protein [Candidatus Saccharimonadales bacterium]